MTISDEAVEAVACLLHDWEPGHTFTAHPMSDYRARSRAAPEAAAPLMWRRHRDACEAMERSRKVEVANLTAERDQARLQAQSLRGDLDRGDVVFRDTMTDTYEQLVAKAKRAMDDDWATRPSGTRSDGQLLEVVFDAIGLRDLLAAEAHNARLEAVVEAARVYQTEVCAYELIRNVACTSWVQCARTLFADGKLRDTLATLDASVVVPDADG